tara:strand:+ start:181 stop:576 length:396 start_codon:yes stop_codon:yes gene_type:complete
MREQISTHALQRADSRLVGDEAEIVRQAVREAIRRYPGKSIGVIAHRLNSQRNQAWGYESNGDCVVAIVRGGSVKTIYLRRATQTFDLSVSRTDVLVDMTGTILSKPIVGRTSTQTRRDVPRDIFNMNRRN